jgi:hypothetical protein
MIFDDLPPQTPINPAADANAATCLELARVAIETVPNCRTLAYGPDPAQRLDVYAPAGARCLPVFAFWHGGGYTHGYKEWCAFIRHRRRRSDLHLARFADLYQEGLQIPSVLPVGGGRMEEGVLAIYEANCRSRRTNKGDIRAILAALETGARRIGAIAETHGADAARIGDRNRLTVGFGDHM